MTRITGGQAAVGALWADGTLHVFDLIGPATMEMFDALDPVRRGSFGHRGG